MKFVSNSTYKDIVLALIIIIPVIFACYINRNNEKIQAILKNTVQAQVYAFEYIEPPLAPVEERSDVIALIKHIWRKDAVIGLELARCESGYRVKAFHNNTNNTQDQGVFQVNTVHKMPDMFNPTANISYAYIKFQEQGTNPWNSSKSCWEK
jgi:hypothetical protein